MANGRVFQAQQAQNGPVPAYEIVELPSTYRHTRTMSTFDEKTRAIVRKEVVTEGGFMVHFPRGHSLYYADLEALQEAGTPTENFYQDMVEVVSLNGESEMNSDNKEKLTFVQTPVRTAK